MLSKSQFKLINSLGRKKYRQQHGLFVAEGKKVIQEFVDSGLKLHSLFTTGDSFGVGFEEQVMLQSAELKRISQLTTPQTALAVFEIPLSAPPASSGLQVVLDSVRDPGNLGTIIRLCDWFGIKDLICSPDTVDCFNPKVVQASMGSLARVNTHYLPLADYLKVERRPVFGTFMNGDSIYEESLPEEGILVMGNEANGISKTIEEYITKRIAIPQFGEVRETESLNVATAAAIVLSEFRRG